MRLFHISEEPDINIFKPRKPYRIDLQDSPPLVWAITEKCMVNFLTPRECPRLTYHIGEKTSDEDINKFFSTKEVNHVVVIESDWLNKLLQTTLYIYEFETTNFYLQDQTAGYYVSEYEEKPIDVITVNDIMNEHIIRKTEFRIIPSLWDLREEIVKSTLNFSLCRLKNAKDADEKL